MNDMQITVSVPVRVEDVSEALLHSHADAEKFVLSLDLQIADAGFTESLIFKLVTSLSGDLSDEEFACLVSDIEKLRG